MLIKFFKESHIFDSLLGTVYRAHEVDEFGDSDANNSSELLDNTVARNLYSYMEERGYEVNLHKFSSCLCEVTVRIKNKEDKGLFAMLNAGVIEVSETKRKQPLPVFKI